MSVQAQSLGLYTRQFRAFDRDGLAAEFAVPAHWEVTTMSAVGRVPSDATAEAAPEITRDRRPVAHILWPHANTNQFR